MGPNLWLVTTVQSVSHSYWLDVPLTCTGQGRRALKTAFSWSKAGNHLQTSFVRHSIANSVLTWSLKTSFPAVAEPLKQNPFESADLEKALLGQKLQRSFACIPLLGRVFPYQVQKRLPFQWRKRGTRPTKSNEKQTRGPSQTLSVQHHHKVMKTQFH